MASNVGYRDGRDELRAVAKTGRIFYMGLWLP
jgi:hypothetical protein